MLAGLSSTSVTFAAGTLWVVQALHVMSDPPRPSPPGIPTPQPPLPQVPPLPQEPVVPDVPDKQPDEEVPDANPEPPDHPAPVPRGLFAQGSLPTSRSSARMTRAVGCHV